MFTGLIKEIGRIRGLRTTRGVVRLDVDAPQVAAGAKLGESIAVNGICLTVVAVKGRYFSVEAASETRRLTTFKNWRSGQMVHLEPALRAGDPLDGHLVQGHVDGTGKIKAIKKSGGSILMTVNLTADLARFLTPKGSVAVDGVSLTVDEGPFNDEFTVNLIPHTLQGTFFDKARSGQQVNLEMDVLVKAARTGTGRPGLNSIDNNNQTKPAASKPAGLTLERLLAKGFGRSAAKGRS
ncbi:MAG: riboflavin synthase [bacterium]|nr:riboflavin synthase [bacterium]